MIIDDIDLTADNIRVYINYMRSDKVFGQCMPADFYTDDDDRFAYIDWLIDTHVTAAKGPLAVLVCVKSVVDGELVTHWSSEITTDFRISEGMECEEVVAEANPGIISELLYRMSVVEDSTNQAWRDDVDARLDDLSPVDDIPMFENYTGIDENAYEASPIVDGSSAVVEKITGKSAVSENLIRYPYTKSTTTTGGITFTDNGDGTITVNGTSTRAVDFVFINRLSLNAWTNYTFSGCPAESDGSYYLKISLVTWDDYFTDEYDDTGSGVTFMAKEGGFYDVRIHIDAGVTINNLVFKPMLNIGYIALPCKPYSSDIKHARINSIVSTGRNLLNLLGERTYLFNNVAGMGEDRFIIGENEIKDICLSNSAMDCIKYHKIYPAGTYTLTCEYASLEDSDYAYNGCITYVIHSNSKPAVQGVDNYNVYYDGYPVTVQAGERFVLTATEDFTLSIAFRTGTNDEKKTGIYTNIQMVAEDTYAVFEPYKEHVWQLPETLELGGYDELNPQTGILRRKTSKIVFDGSEGFIASSTDKTNAHRILLPVPESSNNNPSVASNLICNHYATLSSDMTYMRRNGCGMDRGYLYFFDKKYSDGDITKWKAYLAELYAAGTPLIVEYELLHYEESIIIGCPKKYTVYEGGSETISQGTDDNGAYPSIERTYLSLNNPDDTSTGRYVIDAITKLISKSNPFEQNGFSVAKVVSGGVTNDSIFKETGTYQILLADTKDPTADVVIINMGTAYYTFGIENVCTVVSATWGDATTVTTATLLIDGLGYISLDTSVREIESGKTESDQREWYIYYRKISN